MTIGNVFAKFQETIDDIEDKLLESYKKMEETRTYNEKLNEDLRATAEELNEDTLRRIEAIEQRNQELGEDLTKILRETMAMKEEVATGLQTLNSAVKSFNEFTQESPPKRDNQLDEILDLLKRKS